VIAVGTGGEGDKDSGGKMAGKIPQTELFLSILVTRVLEGAEYQVGPKLGAHI
jgi:hypothetical protein